MLKSPPAWSMPHSTRNVLPLEMKVVRFDAGQVTAVVEGAGNMEVLELFVVLEIDDVDVVMLLVFKVDGLVEDELLLLLNGLEALAVEPVLVLAQGSDPLSIDVR